MQIYSPNPQRPLSRSGLVLRNLHFACTAVGSDAMVLLPHLSNSEGKDLFLMPFDRAADHPPSALMVPGGEMSLRHTTSFLPFWPFLKRLHAGDLWVEMNWLCSCFPRI